MSTNRGPALDNSQPPDADVSSGVLQGKYRLLRQLGAGGMGIVYEAHDEESGREVAIKLLRPEIADSEHGAERLLNEARAASSIDNEHIVRILDVGELASGTPFLVMERLHGDDFERLLRAQAPLAIAGAVDFVVEALEAIAAAHAKGIVHRDLKPSNLFLATRDGSSSIVKVLDFGISRLTASSGSGASITTTGSILGSPAYMAPEQLRSAKHVDARADIWSVGVILYELLTGTSPFARDNPVHVLSAILEETPISVRALREEIPPGLEAVILRCLQRDRRLRFPSARQLAEALSPWGSEGAKASLERIRQVAPPSAGDADAVDAGTLVSKGVPFAERGGTLAEAAARPRPMPSGPASSRSWRGWAVAAVGVVGAAVAGRAWWAAHALPSPRSVALLVRSDAAQPAPAWMATAAEQRVRSALAASDRVRVVPTEKVERHAVASELLGSGEAPRVALQRLASEVSVERLVLLRAETLPDADIRLVADLYDLRDGRRAATLRESGPAADALVLADKLAQSVRDRLRVSTPESMQALRARASLPQNAAAAQKYAEGVALRKAFDIRGAQQALETARDLEPNAPLVHDELAELWSYLGYQERAAAESRRAVELASELRHDERLRVQARAAVVSHDWDRAIEAYRALALLDPEEWDDALAVVETMIQAGRAVPATAAIDELAAREGAKTDPRLGLLRARVAAMRGDHLAARELARGAREDARDKGLPDIATQSDAVICSQAPESAAAKEGMEACRRAVEVYRGADNIVGEATVAARWAYNSTEQGQGDDARKLLEDIERRVQRLGLNAGWVRVLIQFGHLQRRQGQFDGARDFHNRALAMARELGDAELLGRALSSLAGDELDTRHREEAERLYLQAFDVEKNGGLLGNAANELRNVALLHYKAGNLAKAKQTIEDSLRIFHELKEEYMVAWALETAGFIAADRNELDDASRYLEESLAVREKNQSGTGDIRYNFAELLLRKGDVERAVAESGRAVRDLRDAGLNSEKFALQVYASALAEKGDGQGALDAAERAFAIEDPGVLASTKRMFIPVLAKAKFELGDKTGLRELERIVGETTNPKSDESYEGRVTLGGLLIKDGQVARGRTVLTSVRADAQASGALWVAEQATRLLR